MPPLTPRGACIIRFSVCSEHQPEDIEALLAVIDAVMGARRLNGKVRDERAFTSSVGIVVATRGVDTEIHSPLEMPRGVATRP